MKYSFDPDAQTEYFEAIQYYEHQAEGLGSRFIADVEDTIGLLPCNAVLPALLTSAPRMRDDAGERIPGKTFAP